MPLSSRLTGTVPLSIAVHLVALLLLLVVPLVADMPLPSPATSLPDYVRAMPIPAPPPAPRAAAAPRALKPLPAVSSAPVSAPNAILPERPSAPTSDSAAALGNPLGIQGGIGDTFGGGAPVDLPAPLPAPAPRVATPVRVAELPQPPRKTVDARPIYPEFARAAHVGGTVVIEAIIDRTGRVDQLRVLRSIPLLDQAALDAVRQWRYTPSTLHGQPVAVLMTITVNFELQ